MNSLLPTLWVALMAALFLAILVVGFRVTFYRWWLAYHLQIDSRYQNDDTWRAAADSALWNHREEIFALKHALVSEIPFWYTYRRFMIAGGFATEMALFLIGQRLFS
ncbi:MAG TPA: hypothetical protein VFQ91_14965 [Bryobacteraceae bacterium]|nr:hypothetical protein [Bryobacteraceae bacterium]